ncbi:MAG TPA: hypothetical protein VG733_04230, partial [Chthoniobacteraceae bacterium]|nr:hypothetical protein [Chthoniobacteraceae bacterium]
RYRMAAVPGLLLMAAIGLWECWSWLARAQWRQPALYAAGCAAAVFFVALPVTDGDGLWSLDYYNSGFKAAENAGKDREKAKQERDTGHADEARGDLESAKSNLEDARQDFETSDRDMKQARIDLETAFAYVPYNSEINFALGNWWLAKDDPALAKAFYLRAIMVNSRNTGAFNNLGTISMDDGQWPFAAACFEKVVLIEPGDAKAWYLLAKAREGGGDLPGADKAIKQALTLVPDQKQFQQLAAEIAERMQKQ